MIENNRRHNGRRDVDWLAHASNPKFHFVGARVLDASTTGVFFEKPADRPAPKPGDVLSVDLFTKGMAPTLRTKGIVKWVGHSHTHNCDGIGIQFEAPTTEHDLFS